jgi:hypothetical protein
MAQRFKDNRKCCDGLVTAARGSGDQFATRQRPCWEPPGPGLPSKIGKVLCCAFRISEWFHSQILSEEARDPSERSDCGDSPSHVDWSISRKLLT